MSVMFRAVEIKNANGAALGWVIGGEIFRVAASC